MRHLTGPPTTDTFGRTGHHHDARPAGFKITRSRADLYELINERAGRSLILTSNRSPVDWYPLFPNPVVAESLLDRLINNSHQLLMNGASYRPHKRPGRVVTQATTTTS